MQETGYNYMTDRVGHGSDSPTGLQYLADILAGKNVSEMNYFVSGETKNRKSINRLQIGRVGLCRSVTGLGHKIFLHGLGKICLVK